MLTVEEIKAFLDGKSLTQVAKDTGVTRQTLWQIRSGKHTNITMETAQKLSAHIATQNDE